jgi:putative flippase GtrA
MIGAFASWQFGFFLLTGGTAAAVNFASRIFYNQWLDYSTSVIVAYLTGMVTAFVLARLFVFKESNQKWHRSAVAFTLVNVAAVFGQCGCCGTDLGYQYGIGLLCPAGSWRNSFRTGNCACCRCRVSGVH